VGLVQGTGGNFYGTTISGGANGPAGTVFKITPSGTLTTLYSFCSQSGCTDGNQPYAGLVQATGGNFYGTTRAGGAQHVGTVFKITPSGTLTTLHDFHRLIGENPDAALVQATDGNLYGTTAGGGVNGVGTVFRVTPSGALATLYSFCAQTGCTDGQNPNGLVQATDGNLYGTTSQGGAGYCNGGSCGTVFKITPSGTLTTLHSFNGTDGQYPLAALIQATDGNFYGTTYYGGVHSSGTVFKITPTGTLTTLHSFCPKRGCPDGYGPLALVQVTDGSLYGTTFYGGVSTDCGVPGCGTVFSLSVGLGPFVKTQPDWGRAGRFVEILGTNLTGSTSVTFNGTPAVFRVVPDLNSLIKTTVPAGATTGTVQVVTPGGTLSSNVPFRVLP
jgi:uncharacterized repeat protein (TIGR03803 family)